MMIHLVLSYQSHELDETASSARGKHVERYAAHQLIPHRAKQLLILTEPISCTKAVTVDIPVQVSLRTATTPAEQDF